MSPADAPEPAVWTELIAKYQAPDRRRSILQILNSFVSFFALLYLMYLSLAVSYWLTLVLAIPAAGMLARIFIIQHDCGHGSFFKSSRANDLLGFVCGVLTMTPYRHWRLSHAIHHRGAANLARRGVGDIHTLTVGEYLELPRWRRLAYRIYRHPIFLFVLGPFVSFVILQRFWVNRSSRREWASLYWTNLAIGGLAAVFILAIGFRAMALVYAPVMVVAASVGTWLFYVQHQYEETYWARDAEWNYALAALRGSSYYKLPGVLRWFTGNIGFHHVHHLGPMIPNYKLKQCHEENPLFHQATVLTLGSSLHTASLRLWDEESERLVGFRHLRSISPRLHPGG